MSIVEAQSESSSHEHSNPLNVEEKVEEEEGEEENESGVVRSLFGDGSKTKYCVFVAIIVKKHTSISTNKKDQGQSQHDGNTQAEAVSYNK
jgi:hypothetical protein